MVVEAAAAAMKAVVQASTVTRMEVVAADVKADFAV